MPNSARYELPFLSAGQAQKELTHNEALALIDAGLHASAETIGATAPPSSHAPGQCWIVGTAPTGEWAGHAHALACWTEGGWRFLGARQGMRVWLIDQQLWAERTGSGWVTGDVCGSRLILGGAQVVGTQQAAVAAPSGGAVIDVEARAALATLVDRLVAHGLIAA